MPQRKVIQVAGHPPAQLLSSQLLVWCCWLRVLSKHLLRGRRILRPSHWPSSSLFVAPWGSQAPKTIHTDQGLAVLRECIDGLY